MPDDTNHRAHSPMTVGVLALQGDFREHREVLEGMGHCVREIRKPGQLDEIDALIIPGGESTTIARLILSNGFQQPLRDFCRSGKPVWGTCAGAILLAKDVDNLDRPGIEMMDISVHRNAFGRQVEVRCWDSADAVTATPTEVPFHLLCRVAERITREIPEVVSVTYNIATKPPSCIEPV